MAWKFTAGDQQNHLRSGDFATVERIGDDNSISARLDSGRAVELNREKARHIDHGYTVESAQHLSADRIFLTGESNRLAEQQAALTKLNPHTREIAIYTSDGTNPLQQAPDLAKGVEFSQVEPSIDLSSISEPILPELTLKVSASESKHPSGLRRLEKEVEPEILPTYLALAAALTSLLACRGISPRADLKAG